MTDSNIFNFTIDIPTLTFGGEIEEKQLLIRGGNTMKELLQRYKDYLCGEHSRKNTIDNKLTAIRILLHQTQGIINNDTIQRFKTWANQHYSHNSRNNRINAWNQYLRWIGHPELQMKHIGFIETNQYALNEAEIDLLINQSMSNPLEHLILLCLFDGALRPSEIIDIRLNRRDGNRLYLDDTKTGDKRIILSPMLQQAWDDYLWIRPQAQSGHEQYLILKDHYKQRGTKYSSTDPLIDLIQGLGISIGLNKDITPYTIRRTSATLRQNKYSKYYMGDDKLVQMLFRHKDIATTKRYDRTTDTDIERYFDDLSNRDKQAVSGVNRQGRDINLIYSPQDLELNKEGDNSCYSFSYSFFVDGLSVTRFCITERGMVGLVTDDCAIIFLRQPPRLTSSSSSSSPLNRNNCVDEGAIRGFLFFHNFFLPNDFFVPGLFRAPPLLQNPGVIPGCGVASSEQAWPSDVVWCSNPGQVRALESQYGGLFL